MIKGMTGFGTALFSTERFKGFVEIKSQNHRYLDIVFYLPPGFASLENKMKGLIAKDMARGRISVAVRITEKPEETLSFNKDVVRQYLKHAKALQKQYHLANNLTLADLIHLPGVFDVKATALEPDKLWPFLEKGIKRAMTSVVLMRKREGRALSADSKKLLTRMSLQIKKIHARTKTFAKERKKKELSEEALSTKSYDISEEIIRLKHYVDEYRILMGAHASVGKKLDFVAQEMQRETNTIGSKLQDKVISNAVISIKSKIEKLREQAQNIE